MSTDTDVSAPPSTAEVLVLSATEIGCTFAASTRVRCAMISRPAGS